MLDEFEPVLLLLSLLRDGLLSGLINILRLLLPPDAVDLEKLALSGRLVLLPNLKSRIRLSFLGFSFPLIVFEGKDLLLIRHPEGIELKIHGKWVDHLLRSGSKGRLCSDLFHI